MTESPHDGPCRISAEDMERHDTAPLGTSKRKVPPLGLCIVLTAFIATVLTAYSVGFVALLLGSYLPAFCTGLWYFVRRSESPHSTTTVLRAGFESLFFAIVCVGASLPIARLLNGQEV